MGATKFSAKYQAGEHDSDFYFEFCSNHTLKSFSIDESGVIHNFIDFLMECYDPKKDSRFDEYLVKIWFSKHPHADLCGVILHDFKPKTFIYDTISLSEKWGISKGVVTKKLKQLYVNLNKEYSTAGGKMDYEFHFDFYNPEEYSEKNAIIAIEILGELLLEKLNYYSKSNAFLSYFKNCPYKKCRDLSRSYLKSLKRK